MEAYCMKCKTKREMRDPEATFNAAGAPVTRGTCSVCGTKMYRTGRTSAHEGLTPPETPPRKRRKQGNRRKSGKLVIVESPAKARTVGRYLGKDYTVKASVGHVRDLLRSRLSVDVENDFQPQYRIPNEKRQVVKELKKLAASAEKVYLATDPDREGEAIAWHLTEAIDLEPERTERITFHEITKPAIEAAFSHPRKIDMNLVNAQQARRVLDRLVGYNLSPILWEKVRGRLSAGRVQSTALRLIVEREREIENFRPEEYWTIAAQFQPENTSDTFLARLLQVDEATPELKSEAAVRPIVADMQDAQYRVKDVRRGTRQRNAPAPFTTSTLQQEASRKLGFTTRRTMALAQSLYEGIDLGDGPIGLITYMRTDSVNVSELAQQEAREYIAQKNGKAFLPETPPRHKTKAVAAQEAHEAIRPTSIWRTPDSLKPYLDRAQMQLYRLIWQRFLASQMTPAVYDTLRVDIEGRSAEHVYLLRANGSTLRFPGFLIVYQESADEDSEGEKEADVQIPADIAEGQRQILKEVLPEQHFTQPPPRYSEATLVRTLEENGIGRPSTYAPILSTLQQRGYVRRENKRLVPTETGVLVNDLLVAYFPDIVDTGFTAQMEARLDEIAQGKVNWVDVLRDFYPSFAKEVERARAEMPEKKQGPEPVGRDCPECGRPLVFRHGRYGKFISCSGFPECRYTEPYLEKIGVLCPKDGGDIVQRRSRKGRIFYGCSNYPKCDFTSWTRPIAQPCPSCGGMLTIVNKQNVRCMDCEETFPQAEIVGETEE